jgi:sec-independent protein translocase protein TatA
MGIENPVHLIFLVAVALLVLGPRRLPEVARSLGKGIREFRDAMSEGSAGTVAAPAEHATSAQADPAPVPAPDPVLAPAVNAATASRVDPAEPVRSGDAPDRRSL